MPVFCSDIENIGVDASFDPSSFSGKTFFVTGATGLIGSLFVRALKKIAPGARVLALVRDERKGTAVLGESAVLVKGDVRERIFIDEPIDYIVHCAAVTTSKLMVDDPVGTFGVAVKGTENVLELAREQKNLSALLYLSSMEVYGTTTAEQNPVTEEKLGYVDLFSPRSSYPEGKRVSELMCMSYYTEYGVPARTARLAQTFGAGMPLNDTRAPMQFARAAVSGRDIVLHTAGRSVSNFCYTTDAIRGLFTILDRGENGQAYNVCNDAESRAISEIAELVAGTIAGGRIGVVYDIPDGNAFGYAPDAVMRLCSDKLRALGWEPKVGMEEAYRRLTEYIRESEL